MKSLEYVDENVLNKELIVKLVFDICQNESEGAILIFVAGLKEIRDLIESIKEKARREYRTMRAASGGQVVLVAWRQQHGRRARGHSLPEAWRRHSVSSSRDDHPMRERQINCLAERYNAHASWRCVQHP